MKKVVRPLLPALLMLVAFTTSGCFLISADFEGDVNVTFEFDERNENTYSDIRVVDPNEFQDYRDNRDRIDEGELLGIDITFINVPSVNTASIASGTIQIRQAGSAEDFVQVLGRWNRIPIRRDQTFPVELNTRNLPVVNDILFGANAGAFEMRVRGDANEAPIVFDAQATIRLRFTAGL